MTKKEKISDTKMRFKKAETLLAIARAQAGVAETSALRVAECSVEFWRGYLQGLTA